MTDQCKFCEFRGDFDACILAECGHHDNWIALQHKERAESLLAQLEEMREGLLKAADLIEEWGAYASPYFQEKHDLDGDVKRITDLASKYSAEDE